jgi:protein phosphatase
MSATSFMERKTDPAVARAMSARGERIDACGMSRRGRQRPDNQDRFALRILRTERQPAYACVADGVGGAPAGRLASAIAVATVREALDDLLPGLVRPAGEETDPEGTLRRVVLSCQSAVEAHVGGHPEAWGMATTLLVGCVLWPRIHLVHVGDSRAYLLRGSRLRRLTHDHTCAQALIDRGVFAEGSEGAARWKNVILNLVGGRSSEVKPDVFSVGVRGGDTVLLCTDGLSDSLDEARIAQILRTPGPAEEVCRRLVEEAEGGDDVTVVVLRFGRQGLLRRIRGWLRPS